MKLVEFSLKCVVALERLFLELEAASPQSMLQLRGCRPAQATTSGRCITTCCEWCVRLIRIMLGLR